MVNLFGFFRQIGFCLLVSFWVVYGASSWAAPTKDNTLSVSSAFEFNSLDPSKNGYIYTRMQLLETLVDVNAEGQLVPALASKWQVASDVKSWRFTLREGVHFHDGSVMDANAVVKSLTIAQQKHGALRKAPIASIQALDNKTVEVRLTKPYLLLGAILANYSNAIMAPAAYGKDGEVLVMSGTGPYQLLQYAPPHKLVVEKFEGYWGKPASIPYASYLTGHRAESRVMQARSGQADIVFGLDPAALPLLKRVPSLTLYSNPIPRTIALKVNSGHVFLSDVRARQALSLAINRAGIANGILRTPGSEAEQLLPPSMTDWYLPNISQETMPLETAQALLSSLGWQKNAEGVLERDGKTFDLTLITYADRPELTTVATAIQAQWNAIGVRTKVDVTNSSAIPLGHQDGSLEVALIARNYGFIADPLGVILSDFGANGGGDWGAMNWHNDTMGELLKTLEYTTDPKKYHQLAQQAAQLIYQQRPMIPVSYYVQQTAVNNRVKGFHFDPFERSFFLNDMEFVKP